jgi:hypothetical protein
VSLAVYVPVIDAVPAAVGVNVTEHVPAAVNVQLVALKVPARPVAVNATEPAGVLPPIPLVSATVAVHVDAWLIGTDEGAHTTVVDVVLLVPTTEPLVAPLLALPAWTVSLGVYVPVMVAVPAAVGVNVTEQVPAADKVQLGALKVPARPAAVNATDPAGVLLPTPLVSATVAVHVEAWPIGTDAGAQTTVVEVVRRVPITEPLVAPLLALPA